MGLIVRTVISVTMIIKDMFEHSEQEQDKTMMYIILFLFVVRGIIQFVLNFVRISSQGGG